MSAMHGAPLPPCSERFECLDKGQAGRMYGVCGGLRNFAEWLVLWLEERFCQDNLGRLMRLSGRHP
jgi:hypothetical protein